MRNHNQVILPVDDAHDVSIISYEINGKIKYEIAIMGPEGIFHDDVMQLENVADLQKYLTHYFGDPT